MGFIILGIILIIAGGILVIKTNWIYNFFGAIPFAEKFLSSEGGSILAYKLIGLIIIFIGFLLVFNLFGPFMRAVMPSSISGG